MRTTIDLPEDIHRLATSIARDKQQTLSQAVVDLVRRAIDTGSPSHASVSPITGLTVLHLGGPPITSDEVSALDEEE